MLKKLTVIFIFSFFSFTVGFLIFVLPEQETVSYGNKSTNLPTGHWAPWEGLEDAIHPHDKTAGYSGRREDKPTSKINAVRKNDSLLFVSIDGATFQVEIADTPEEQSRGLSGKDSLAEGRGMLFVFEKPARHAFWMKDMRFPIDIIWINEDWRIVDITERVSPDTFPKVFRPKVPARYVLEVNAGEAVLRGIRIGSRVMFSSSGVKH